jgi:predicted DNA-binding transcriptional regulator AlpA
MNATREATGSYPTRRVRSSVMSPDELASIAELAQMLRVTTRTAQRYADRPDFPEPAERIAGGRIRVWRRGDVEAWGRDHLPLRTGRPPKRQA